MCEIGLCELFQETGEHDMEPVFQMPNPDFVEGTETPKMIIFPPMSTARCVFCNQVFNAENPHDGDGATITLRAGMAFMINDKLVFVEDDGSLGLKNTPAPAYASNR